MKFSKIALLFSSLLVLTLLSGPASAETLKFSFTGEVAATADSAAQTVDGWLSIDFGRLQTFDTDESTYSVGGLLVSPPDVSPGNAHFAFSGGAVYDLQVGLQNYASVYVLRDASTILQHVNEYTLDVGSQASDGRVSAFILKITDALGTDSNIFTSPPGDLSWTQIVNWNALGATAIGTFFTATDNSNSLQIDFAITSVTVSMVPEPSHLLLMLSGLAVLGLRLAKRSDAGT